MTREIKFRAWNGATMEYNIVAGKFGAFFVNPGIKGDGLDSKDAASLTQANTIYSKEVPVMQFTGLKDKNGKEIYEGDILQCDIPQEHFKFRFIGDVRFGDGHFYVYGKYAEPLSRLKGEVIGNIYENSELIK